MLRVYSFILGAALVAAGCGSQEKVGSSARIDKGALMDPQSEAVKEQAPDQFAARFETSAGDFTIEVERDLASQGADRFYNLVKNGYYDGQRFFRVVPGFVVQWGMHGDPEITAQWQNARIPDDPVKGSNVRGTITFATSGANSRTTQLFINLGDNAGLDNQGFAPFGRVADGMQAVDAINAEYGQRPSQQDIGMRGNAYLEEKFPNLDYVKTASIVD